MTVFHFLIKARLSQQTIEVLCTSELGPEICYGRKSWDYNSFMVQVFKFRNLRELSQSFVGEDGGVESL